MIYKSFQNIYVDYNFSTENILKNIYLKYLKNAIYEVVLFYLCYLEVNL